MQYTNRYSNIIILPKCGKTDKLNNHQNSKITDCKLLKGNARQSIFYTLLKKFPDAIKMRLHKSMPYHLLFYFCYFNLSPTKFQLFEPKQKYVPL